MQEIQQQMRNRAKELLESKEADLIIGYTIDAYGKPTAAFVDDPVDVERLIWDQRCAESRSNLIGYIKRHEVKRRGKIAVVANAAAKRAVNVLVAESQMQPGDVILIDVEPDVPLKPDDGRYAKLDTLLAMSREERFAYWKKELARCVKCYACRQSCPMCYCPQCIVDKNRPQRIDTSSNLKGNFAWNITRAFHLAGRCVSCGACAAACPAGIDLDLLNLTLAKSAEENFDGYVAGLTDDVVPVVGQFSLEDKEEFIR